MAGVPKIVFVGGFLGAGKTSLILYAARQLHASNRRAAIILNDQDSELVDTKYAEAQGLSAREVAGGCFCCRFSDLLGRAKDLRTHNPDVIFAEPVGSCIDLSATILHPLLAFHRDEFAAAPLTVLLDPRLTRDVLNGDTPSEISYLFENQRREADLLCLTKADLYPEVPELPFPIDFRLSSRSGFGVDAWLREVLGEGRVAGARLLDVDYAQYANAEDALGWLNVYAAISLERPLSPALVCGPLLDRLDDDLTANDLRIAHLKLFDQSATGHVMVSIRANGDNPDPRGDLIAEPTTGHQLAINVRALGDPARLREIVERALSEIPGSVEVRHLRAFRPPAPKPEHRQTEHPKLNANGAG